ncbi:MAG: hypothetical protein LBN10_11120 [Propionibacteriaceae bacterium]|jgi:hypothetical protein|nr:hypothetical protein [Propionibacteriaceae bacterium]
MKTFKKRIAIAASAAALAASSLGVAGVVTASAMSMPASSPTCQVEIAQYSAKNVNCNTTVAAYEQSTFQYFYTGPFVTKGNWSQNTVLPSIYRSGARSGLGQIVWR